MEKKDNPTLNIIFINFDDDLINSILEFQGKSDNSETEEKINKWSEKKLTDNIFYEREIKFNDKDKEIVNNYYWKSIIYPKLTEENEASVFESLIENQLRNKEKLIIIIFGKKYLNDLIELQKELKEDEGKEIKEIGIVTDEKYINSKNDCINMYLTNIKYDKENIEETRNNIYDYLTERDFYFNERGDKNNIINSFDLTLNIFLMGISRRGKSSFINLLSKKFVALSKSGHEGMTKGITPYYIYENINNKKIGIKLYDSPGFTDKSEEIKKVKETIENFLKSEKDSIQEFHLFYFFLSQMDNLDNAKEGFKIIKEKNEERKKEGLKEIPVIFIYNMNYDQIDKDELKVFLSKNGFISLYNDNIFENQNKKKGFLKKKTKDNIIITNLKSVKGSKIDGIELLLETSFQLLKNSNNIEEKDFEELKELHEKIELLKKDNDINKLNEYENNFKKKKGEISKKYSFFHKCNNVDKIIEEAREKSKKDLYYYASGGTLTGLLAGFIGKIPFADKPVLGCLYYYMIDKISKNFGMKNTFGLWDIAKLTTGFTDLKNGISPGTKFAGYQLEESINIYQKKVWAAHGGYISVIDKDGIERWIFNNELYEQKVLDKMHLKKLFSWESYFYKFSKYVPILSGLIGGYTEYNHTFKIGEQVIKYFEEEIRKDKGYNYIKGIKDNLMLLFNFIEKKAKENWNEYLINEKGNFES